jgi:DNA-binding SARP family transcriptional activator/TolB-like protein
VQVRLLGPLQVRRGDRELALPSSRKVRALLAYLALARNAVTRTHLCEMLWDVPNDPKGELRWCLSKLRGVLDEPGRKRVKASRSAVEFDFSDCDLDVREVARATQEGIGALSLDALRALCGRFAGDFLDGLEIDRSPSFDNWVMAQRRRFRGCHAALLEQISGKLQGEEQFAYLEKWIELAPFDKRVHEVLLGALAAGGRLQEGEAHVATTIRAFDAEGLDGAPIRDAWIVARARTSTAAAISVSPPQSASLAQPANEQMPVPAGPRRASVAVMPFVDRAGVKVLGTGSADGLVRDIITRLAKLRSLFVIAQGTVFALHERAISPQEAGRTLNVDYVVSGSLMRDDRRMTVAVELAEARTARIVWTDVFEQPLDYAFLTLDEIGNRIVASIAGEIEDAERNRAILKPPNSLDAWEAHHRGLWHMYRFSKPDNDQAQHFFEMAVRLDPTFARAYAGLSFTHFQNAFQGWSDRQLETDKAYEAASQGLMIDDHDPAAHWAMGRAQWLLGRQDQSLAELERSVDLSPNFALAHYTLSFVHSQSGDPSAAITASDHSRHLSPFDPLLFGMLGARAMALARLGRFEEAAEWGSKAAARPNAHSHIRAIAACCLALAEREEEARRLVAAIHAANPSYRVEDFLAAFRFEPGGAAVFRKGAKRIGFG